MTVVLCTISMMLSTAHFESVEAWGKVIRDDNDKWYVDFTDYMSKHPQYREWNYNVQAVNSNDCLFLRRKHDRQNNPGK